MRRGAGRIRHIAAPTLWLQKLITDRQATVTKNAGTDNCADFGAKHLDAKTMEKHMRACCYRFVSGRSSLALSAHA